MEMKRKIIAVILLLLFTAIMIYGIWRGDLGNILGFGIFLCLDCIGIS